MSQLSLAFHGLITQNLGQRPAVLSTDVARRFQKKHKNILREIDRIRSICPKSFNGLNFEPVDYADAKGEKRPAWLLTRDAFSLLVMGMTGKAALVWKLRYIEAFNALEGEALSRRTELAREAGYEQGRDEARSLPAIQAERQAGYLEGLVEGKKLGRGRDRLTLLRRALGYARLGLSQRDTGKILGISKDSVYRLHRTARELGMAARQGVTA